MNRLDRVSAYDYGRLAITSLTTTAAGALLALLAFLGQAKGLTTANGDPIFWGVGLLGLALALALLSSVCGYLNQAALAFRGELLLLLRIAILSAILSFIALCAGAAVALVSVRQVVEHPAAKLPAAISYSRK